MFTLKKKRKKVNNVESCPRATEQDLIPRLQKWSLETRSSWELTEPHCNCCQKPPWLSPEGFLTPVQFSCSVVSGSLQPHGLQHTRLPCPSPAPGACSNSCASNYLILCRPFPFLPSIFPSIRVFSNESVLCIRWPKYWSFSWPHIRQKCPPQCSPYSALTSHLTSLVPQTVKNLPATQETCFDPWVGKIPWRREQLPTPVFLPGECPWTEEPGGLQSMGSQRVGHDWTIFTSQCQSSSRNFLCLEAMNIGY